MRNLIYVLILTVVAISCRNSQSKVIDEKAEPVIVIDQLNESSLYSALFNAPGDDWCVWTPVTSDSAFPVADDGKCHTKLDKVIHFNSGDNRYAAAILGTYEFADGEPQTAHAYSPMMSIATFIQTSDNQWSLISFEKDFGTIGSYNTLGSTELIELGDEKFLKICSVFVSQGCETGGDIIVHLPSLKGSIYLAIEVCDYEDMEYYEDSLTDLSANGKVKVEVTRKDWIGPSGEVKYSNKYFKLDEGNNFVEL